jgi:hypothetical protein
MISQPPSIFSALSDFLQRRAIFFKMAGVPLLLLLLLLIPLSRGSRFLPHAQPLAHPPPPEGWPRLSQPPCRLAPA